MSTLTLEAATFLSLQDQAEFYLSKARHYRKLAANAHSTSVRAALEAVARDFAQRALDATNRQ